MKKPLFLFVLCFLMANALFAQLQSPEQFLGYKIGTHYTPHYKIVNYVKSVAQAKPDMVKIEKYGETYEGRELLIVFIANADNLRNLESIRQNNLSLAGLGNNKSAATNGSPAITWLSYNVHGNEPASSEAAMLTLYSLVDPANAQTKEWLKNTVVVIDPCINPDGRDRYVNWYNSVVGQNYNPDPSSREHAEPWPAGRTNHYNFDLNRDWAWQTQKETRQRLAKYNEWLPQIHVDFHEQGYNQPYYFAPAAEPFHEVITPWQREFQNIIGRNNAKYFDQSGWLYFTKERFDLFYPSYGDTYPLYNGAIGMTFEQGGIRGGLGIITASGDTLTLVDRVTHHYTTGLSTIEMAAQNSSRLVLEYKKFFDESRSGKESTVKTYVLTSDNPAKINSLAHLLKVNGIEFGTVGDKPFRGMNYTSGKQETGSLKKYNIAVSSLQAKSVLARVLLEPKSKLADSITYDITAWSLPYVYGVDAYAVSDASVSIQAYKPFVAVKQVAASSYGYLINYNSINSAKVLGQLLKQGIKVRFSEKPFTYNQKQYERGTLIVLQKSNPLNLQSILNDLSVKNEVEFEAVSSGFMDKGPDFGSPDIRSVRAPKVALLTGEQTSSLAAGEVWHFFEQQLDYPLTLINVADLGRISLKNFNVLIVPDGNYRNLADKNITDKLREFVNSGGNLIAMEDGAKQIASADWSFKLKEDKDDKKDDKDDYTLLKKFENRERDELRSSIPGAIYRVQLDNTHPLAFGFTDTYYTLKQNSDVYEFLKDGWNVGIIKKDNYITGFAGTRVKSLLKDGVVFGVNNIGNGSVTFLADDPLFREFWESGKLLFANAVFLVSQ